MADNTRKTYTVVLASQGMDKVESQVQALNKAASAFDGNIERMGQSLNANSGIVRQTFKVMAAEATSFNKIVGEINAALIKQGGLARFSNDFKIKTDLSSIKQDKNSGIPSTGVGSAAWKAENALRAEANRQVEREKTVALRRAETEERLSAKRSADDYVTYWKQALKEREVVERQAASARVSFLKNAIAKQEAELANRNKVSRASAIYGDSSPQVALAKAAVQEAQIKASLEKQISRIQTQFAAGSLSGKAAATQIKTAYAGASTEIDKVTSSLKKAETAQTSFAGRVIESISIYRALNFAINTTLAGLKSIPTIGIALEQSTATLQATFGSYGQAAKQLQFLNEEADRTGLALGQLRKSYATFSASALLAGQSAASVQKIFQDVNTVSTTLHLSTDQVNGVFLALSQIFNKNKLQAEELTKQLAQTLPGITNQAAIALGKSAAQLGEDMKKGLVSADEAVEKMMAKMASAFGGEAFKRASANLNAELGRLNTSWTHFAENMAKASDSWMIAVVKGSSGVLDALAGVTSNVYNTERAFVQFAGTVGPLMLGAFTGMAAGALKTKLAIDGTILSVTGLTAAARAFAPTALLLGLSAIAGYAIEAATAMSSARKTAQDLMKARAGLTLQGEEKAKFNIDNNPELQDLKGKADVLRKRVENAGSRQDRLKGLGIPTKSELQAELTELENTYKEKVAQIRKEAGADPQKALKGFEAEDFTKVQLQLEAKNAKAAGNAKLSAQLNARTGYLDEISKTNDEIKRAEKALASGTLDEKGTSDANQYIKGLKTQLADIENTIKNSGDKIKQGSKGTGGSGISSAIRASYKDAAEAVQEQRNTIQTELGELENLYTNSGISIASYFEKQRNLYSQDIALQRQAIQENLQTAQASGDVVKVADLRLQLSKLSGEEAKKQIALTNQESKAYLSLADTIRSVNYEYAQSRGKSGEPAAAKFAKDNINRINDLMKAYGDAATPANVRDEAGAALQELGNLQKTAVAVDTASVAYTKYAFAKDYLAQKEERIQNALRVGAISELTALNQTDEARKQSIAIMEQWIAVQSKALEGQSEDSPAVLQLRRAQLELETLQSQANLFGAKFEKIFSDNVARGFKNFITGSMSAKEAFASFATGIIGDLAEIAAQEAATSIAGIGKDLFGSIFKNISFSANGNAFSGASGYANTILSQPTYMPNMQVIPLAKGGAIAGEAGKEVVLPLETTSNGKLGVKAVSDGGGGTIIYQITVPVTVHGNTSSAETDALGGKLARSIMKQIASEEIAKAKRSGNSLNKVVY